MSGIKIMAMQQVQDWKMSYANSLILWYLWYEQCPSSVHCQYRMGGAFFILLNSHSRMFPCCFKLHSDLFTTDNLLDTDVGEVVHLVVKMQVRDIWVASWVLGQVR